ncbi:MAG: TIGR03915 family putative DNA repair protein [Bacteroidales bacterium]|nr:TIGR03915 family putative DNA repair protein [Bacteroidales bacterium]
MNVFLYDRTFEGFLSAVFYAYDTKVFPHKIIGSEVYQPFMFAEEYTIYTNNEIAKRVWDGIIKRSSKELGQRLYRVFLSELPNVEMLLFDYVKLTFDSAINIEENFNNSLVVELNKIHRNVSREAERVLMFVRFQKTADGLYYAPYEPKYNVLPLSLKHFKDRFSDQKWVVYDTKRNYGYYYNLEEATRITIDESMVNPWSGKVKNEILDENEMDYQQLWNDYYDTINIKERKNLKVHQQFLPKRFWKYLPEKNQIPKLN